MSLRHCISFLSILAFCVTNLFGQSVPPSLEEVKAAGARQSKVRNWTSQSESTEAPTANLDGFNKHIKPLLEKACYQCHGAEIQEREFRVDTLDPDLIHGDDASWWVEVLDTLSKGEMPPPDEAELPPEGRSRIVEWLTRELQVASQVTRREKGHSSFRRMTRYEYSYALQDLLGLPYDFAEPLPPESVSEDGFLNSSEMLQMSASQIEASREVARQALLKATVRGDQPEPIFYAVNMEFDLEKAKKDFEAELEKIRTRFADKPDKIEVEIAKFKKRFPRRAYYKNLETGAHTEAKWQYHGARYARKPVSQKPDIPPPLANVAVIPMNQNLVVDLGDHLPESGPLRLRIRARAISERKEWVPTLRVYFGHQASNDSRVEEPVSELVISSTKDSFEFYECEIPLSEMIRNVYRGSQKLGQLPNPAEYLKFENSTGEQLDLEIDYIEITTPHFTEWPPASHRRIFFTDKPREIFSRFMSRAWRRPVSKQELDQKLALYEKLLSQCEGSQEAIIEVLAGVLSSPRFLYLVQSESKVDYALATRLAIFLWSSLPDQKLLDLAATEKLSDPDVLAEQVDRMLDDPRAERFSQQFVRQWLGMQLLDYIKVDKNLRNAMHEEPIAFFDELLQHNHSVMDFLHADYTMVNGHLAKHYGLPGVHGPEFRRVSFTPQHRRGGLLTQAGLLAMNSDGEHSHPLKRSIWLLENILNDPPPPPPPAVPEIDLTDPEILKLSLKERMEDHRNDPACLSCHQRIDPWGIAFENYDALGRWRTTINKKPVDANSVLFNNQELNGMDGLKRFLLANRQDQFARAITQKMMTYALGRPLSFGDRSEVDRTTAELRKQGDGLRTLVHLIVKSELFLKNDQEEISEKTGDDT